MPSPAPLLERTPLPSKGWITKKLVDLHGPWELLGHNWGSEGLLGVNMQVQKSQSREGKELGTGLFLREMGTTFTLLGGAGIFLLFYVCVCFLRPLWQGRKKPCK